jgi:hypothetical protein
VSSSQKKDGQGEKFARKKTYAVLEGRFGLELKSFLVHPY